MLAGTLDSHVTWFPNTSTASSCTEAASAALLRVAVTFTSPVAGVVRSTVTGSETGAPPPIETWKLETARRTMRRNPLPSRSLTSTRVGDPDGAVGVQTGCVDSV